MLCSRSAHSFFLCRFQEGQDVYLEVFHTELEAFKQRVRDYKVKSRNDGSNTEQTNTDSNHRVEPKEPTAFYPQVSSAV